MGGCVQMCAGDRRMLRDRVGWGVAQSGQGGHPILQPQCFIYESGEHTPLGKMGLLQDLCYINARLEVAIFFFGLLPMSLLAFLCDKDYSWEGCRPSLKGN